MRHKYTSLKATYPLKWQNFLSIHHRKTTALTTAPSSPGLPSPTTPDPHHQYHPPISTSRRNTFKKEKKKTFFSTPGLLPTSYSGRLGFYVFVLVVVWRDMSLKAKGMSCESYLGSPTPPTLATTAAFLYQSPHYCTRQYSTTLNPFLSSHASLPPPPWLYLCLPVTHISTLSKGPSLLNFTNFSGFML